jgi:hypothetical protein
MLLSSMYEGVEWRCDTVVFSLGDVDIYFCGVDAP